jgi:hypothetical protein
MKPTEFSEKMMELSGWPVRITSYRLGDRYYCKADNVEPGACITRSQGATSYEAEQEAIRRAQDCLSKTRRFSA